MKLIDICNNARDRLTLGAPDSARKAVRDLRAATEVIDPEATEGGYNAVATYAVENGLLTPDEALATIAVYHLGR